MSFLSVLKKVGANANAVNGAVADYGQMAKLVTSFTPGDRDNQIVGGVVDVSKSLVRFQDMIVQAEVFGQAAGLTGPQKAAGIAPAVVQLFLELPILKDKKPKDPAKTKADAAKLAGAAAEFMNGFEG
jgi:hypothetical protein